MNKWISHYKALFDEIIDLKGGCYLFHTNMSTISLGKNSYITYYD